MFLLAIPLCIYVFYSLIVSLGLVGSDEPEQKPESKAEIKEIKNESVKKDLDLTYKPEKFEHPLNEICQDYEYGGYELKKKNGVVTVEHYINCVTGKEVEKQKTILSGDDENPQERQEKFNEPEIILLSSNYLEKLGYYIYLNENLPILKYSGKNIYLAQF